MTRHILIVISFIVLTVNYGQAQVDSFKIRDISKLPNNFQKIIKGQVKEYNRLFSRDSATTKNYSVSFMLDKIDNDSNYHYLFLAEYWIAFHYDEIIPELIHRLTNKKEVGLINSADLIIWERIKSGQMTFDGHGGVSNDDLFTIAGRANRLLVTITGENFGHVSMRSTQQQLLTLQQKWTNWAKNL